MEVERLKEYGQGFPGGAVVKNPPASAGDLGSTPGPGRSHMPWSNWARVPQLLKPVSLEPVFHSKRSHNNEKPCTTTKSSPHLLQLEKAQMQQRRPNTAKKIKTNKLINFKKRVWPVLDGESEMEVGAEIRLDTNYCNKKCQNLDEKIERHNSLVGHRVKGQGEKVNK